MSSNQVTFRGVPVNPPVASGAIRVFRIANVGANIAGLGIAGGDFQTLNASVTVSGSTSFPLLNPVQIAGFIQSGLSTSVRNPANTGSGP